MGICSSCLGIGRRKSSNPETTRLLHDDPYRSQYGTNDQTRQSYQPDPETQRREREALEGICHFMSDEVVDVFTILPGPENKAASEVGRAHLDDHRPETPDHSHDGYKPSPLSLKQYKIEEDQGERVSQEVAYRSVRKLPRGYGTNDGTNEEDNWEAAKTVMG